MLAILLLLCPTYLSNPGLSSNTLPPSPSIKSPPFPPAPPTASSPLLCSSEGLCCPHRSSKCVVKQEMSIYPNHQISPHNPHPTPHFQFTTAMLGINWQGVQVQVVHADHSLDPRPPCYCDPTCVYFQDCCQDFHQFCQRGRARHRRRRKKYRRWIPV